MPNIMKYKQRHKFEKYGTRTKWQNLGREETELDADAIQSIELSEAISRIRHELGYQLFLEWLYITGFIDDNQYVIIRPTSLEPYKFQTHTNIDTTADKA